MGQKVHPIGFRLGSFKHWDSLWYDSFKNYGHVVLNDLDIRRYLEYTFDSKGLWLAKIVIYRNNYGVGVILFVHEPYKRTLTLIDFDKLQSTLEAVCGKFVYIRTVRLSSSLSSASLVAREIALFLEKQGSYKEIVRKIIRQYRATSSHLGILGIKVSCSGRFGGAAIARTEWFKEGQLPLQTLKCNIDYANTSAFTTYGVYGIKVWLYYR